MSHPIDLLWISSLEHTRTAVARLPLRQLGFSVVCRPTLYWLSVDCLRTYEYIRPTTSRRRD